MMKRPFLILFFGLIAAIAGYCALYYSGTRERREMLASPAPELAWLKKEFRLTDLEFERIAKLHDGYLPRCEELCRRIAAKNAEVRQLTMSNVSPAVVEQKLKEAAALRVECHKNMLDHFVEVSHQMPPEQGKRYLEWVQVRTLAPHSDMAERHGNAEHSAHH